MPDNRETLQVNQPDIINLPENNWPEPLADPSNKLKMVVTNGGSGTQTNKDLVSTSQQDAGEHQLAEGQKSGGPNVTIAQGDHSNDLKTSQMNPPNHSAPEGE